MHSLAKQIVERAVADGYGMKNALLQALLATAAADQGVVLRLSARRLVMKLKHHERSWVFKIDSPQRNFERLRGRLRPPSLLREAQYLRQLGLKHLAMPAEIHAEQVSASTGLLARPWISGRCGNHWTQTDMRAAGEGLAKLHVIGWSDPDICPGDLLLDEQKRLLPLDLGHALLHEGQPTPTKARVRDLQRLLGGWNDLQRNDFGAALLAAYRTHLNCPATPDMLHAAQQWRGEILRRQSRCCLRRTRDFAPTADGCERVEQLPSGKVLRFTLANQRQAKRAFRLLYELELLELPALRILRFGKHHDQSYIEVAQPNGMVATDVNDHAVKACLSALHAANFHVQQPSADMFLIDERGKAWLANARNLQRGYCK